MARYSDVPALNPRTPTELLDAGKQIALRRDIWADPSVQKIVDKIFDLFGFDLPNWEDLMGNFDDLKLAVEGKYTGSDPALVGIQLIFSTLRKATGGLIDPSRLPMIPWNQIGFPDLSQIPNLFKNFQFLPGGVGVGEGWSLPDSLPGVLQLDADGTQKVMMSDAVPSAPGQTMDLSILTSWKDVVAGAGDGIKLVAKGFSGLTLVDTQPLQAVTSPSGTQTSWQTLGGEYTVPPGVDNVRMEFAVDSVVSAGQVFFKEPGGARLQDMLMPMQFVSGLLSELADLLPEGIFQNLLNGLSGKLGGPGTGASIEMVTDLFGIIPVGNIFGLDGLLSNLLPKVDWNAFLNQFTAAANSGTAPSPGTVFENALNALLGVRTKAITAQNTANIARDNAVMATQVGDLLITRRSLTQTLGTTLSWTIPTATPGYRLVKTVIQEIGAGDAGSYSTKTDGALYVPGGFPGGFVSREFDAASFPSGTVLKYRLGAGGVGTTTNGVGASGGPTWLKNNAETVTYINPVPGVAELLKLTDSMAASGAPGRGGDGGGAIVDSSYDGTNSTSTTRYFDATRGFPSPAGPGGVAGYSQSGWFGSSYTNGGNGVDAPTNDPLRQAGGSGGGGSPGRAGGFVTQPSAGDGGYPGGAGGGAGLFGAGIGSTRTRAGHGNNARIDAWTYEVAL